VEKMQAKTEQIKARKKIMQQAIINQARLEQVKAKQIIIGLDEVIFRAELAIDSLKSLP